MKSDLNNIHPIPDLNMADFENLKTDLLLVISTLSQVKSLLPILVILYSDNRNNVNAYFNKYSSTILNSQDNTKYTSYLNALLRVKDITDTNIEVRAYIRQVAENIAAQTGVNLAILQNQSNGNNKATCIVI
jgi:hypothetical protein